MEENVETPEPSEQPAAIPETAPEPDKDTKMWAMLSHFGGLAVYIIPFGGVIATLIIWQIKKDEHPYLNENGKEAVNFQISILLYAIIAFLLVFAIIGFFLLPAVGIFNLIMVLIAGVKANNGESFKYPLCIRFIK